MPQVAGFALGALGIGAGTSFLGGAAMFGAWTAGAAFAGTALGAIAIRLTASVALSALARAIAPKPKITIPGLRTDQTLTGGVNPEAIILGRFATAGALAAPLMSHGTAGKTPNAYLTYVVELAGRPGHQIDGLLINGEPVEVLPDSPHADYGQRIGGRFEGRAWVRYYDGTQTAADPMLLAKYPAPHMRPWSADMVGHGLCYAIVTFRYDREVFTQFPSVKFVLTGLPLHDPRLDRTAGGAGPMRWDDPSTWAPTRNLAVMIYNILRGIDLGGDIWGGGIPAEDLPYAVWAAAMDACDAQLSDGAGGTEAAFEGGMEVLADDEPFGAIEELLKGCNGMLAESGGVWSIRIGGPALPVLAISDGDILSDAADDYRPFPPLSEIYNAIEATWTDPGSAWAARDAAPRYNPDWEAEDGGRRLTTSVPLPVVLRGTQADRVMAALIADHRRMRVHQITLPPRAERLRPLETITWTSDSNGYLAKLFEVVRVDRELLTGRVRVTLREIDAGDFAPPVVVRPTPPDLAPQLPAPQGVPGWDVEPWVIEDGAGAPRRPAVRAVWDPDGADDARGIRIAVRLAGEAGAGTEVGMQDLRAGAWVHDAALPGQAYQLRARLVVDRPTAWSAWRAATTPDVRLSMAELDAAARQRVEELEDWIFEHAEIDQDIASVAQRATALETTTANHGSRLATTETAITTNTGSLASLNTRVDASGGLADLVKDPVFAAGFTHWPVGPMDGSASRFAARNLSHASWVYNAMPAPRAMQITPADMAATPTQWKGLAYQSVTVGEEIVVSFNYARAADGVQPRGYIRFRDKGGVVFGTQFISGDGAGSWLTATLRVVVPVGAVEAQAYVIGAGAGWVSNCWVTNVAAKRGQQAYASGALKIETKVGPDGATATLGLGVRAGSIETGVGQAGVYLRASSNGLSELLCSAASMVLYDPTTETAPFAYIDGQLYLNARVTAQYLEIDRLLSFSETGAFSAFKSAPDDSTDGLFVGKVDDKFALSASRTAPDGRAQEVSFTSDGFRLINPALYNRGSVLGPAERKTANFDPSDLTGAKMVRIPSAIGGGGGGGGKEGAPGSKGGDTIIRLLDGSTVMHTFTAPGGAGGSGTARTGNPIGAHLDPGERGKGGQGARYTPIDGPARYAQGGYAGKIISRDWIDISAWTNPRIEIVIGDGGAAGNSSGGNMLIFPTAGTAGAATYQIMAGADVPTYALPALPSGKGTFSKGDNVAGSFPDLGAGLWVIQTTNNSDLNMGDISINATDIVLGRGTSLTFISDRTPTYTGGATARSIRYLFHAMGGG